MKEKLKELKDRREKAKAELRSIEKEIESLEMNMLDFDKGLYKGKWFYSVDGWLDEYASEYETFKMVYVQDVTINYGYTHFSVIILKFDHYYKLQNFEIEVDDNYPIEDLMKMKEVTNHELNRMRDTIGQMFKCLLDIHPQLKEKLPSV